MAAITLISLTCNKTFNSNIDYVSLRVNGTTIDNFYFVASQTKSLSFPTNDTVRIALIIKVNNGGGLKTLGPKPVAVNPSPIFYSLDEGNYSLSYV